MAAKAQHTPANNNKIFSVLPPPKIEKENEYRKSIENNNVDMHRYDKNSTINNIYCHNNRVIELSINYFFYRLENASRSNTA